MNVYLVGTQKPVESEIAKFFADNHIACQPIDLNGECIAEIAGRICYMSYSKPRPGGRRAYIENIIKSGHGSVLEHTVYNFIFDGVSRSLTHELVRHRAGWSYSMVSQRYVDESHCGFVEPDVIANNPEANFLFQEAVAIAQENYQKIVSILSTGSSPIEIKLANIKLARQAARSVLPNATQTKIFCTANARAVRHFIELRGSKHADWEIRKLANKVLDTVRKESPLIFSDYTVLDLGDGTSEITTEYKKV